MLRTFLVVIEGGNKNFSAFVPDLPGCIATGHTYAEVCQHISEAISLHLRGMIEDGDTLPIPTTSPYSVTIDLDSLQHHATTEEEQG